ncbi:MAG: glycerophosphodiester phosphodiesterase family protein [Burkholderiaceae bacterium]
MRLPAWPFPWVSAHRGAGRTAPENTLVAFAVGQAGGARMVECDLRMDTNGQGYLLHDPTLDRTTFNQGTVRTRSADAVVGLPAWRGYAATFSHASIPGLAEVLRWSATHDIFLNLELKPFRGRERADGLHLGRALKEEWPALGMPLLVSSFSPRSLAAVAEVCPYTPRALLRAQWQARDFALARSLGCQAVFLREDLWNRNRIAAAHASGLRTGAYTVNSLARAARLRTMGLDHCISDLPALWRSPPGLP